MNKIKEFIRNNWSDIFKPVTVLLAICVIIPLALSLTNEITAARIENLAAESERETMSELIDADSFEPVSFEGKNGRFDFNIAKDADGKAVGYIFTTSEKGYGGEVSVMTAIDTDGNIKAVSVLDASNETPGLGQNVTKSGFYSQYSGLSGEISVVKSGADSENNEIDAVTGATISSRAVTAAVNRALQNFSEYSSETFKETEAASDEQ